MGLDFLQSFPRSWVIAILQPLYLLCRKRIGLCKIEFCNFFPIIDRPSFIISFYWPFNFFFNIGRENWWKFKIDWPFCLHGPDLILQLNRTYRVRGFSWNAAGLSWAENSGKLEFCTIHRTDRRTVSWKYWTISFRPNQFHVISIEMDFKELKPLLKFNSCGNSTPSNLCIFSLEAPTDSPSKYQSKIFVSFS